MLVWLAAKLRGYRDEVAPLSPGPTGVPVMSE